MSIMLYGLFICLSFLACDNVEIPYYVPNDSFGIQPVAINVIDNETFKVVNFDKLTLKIKLAKKNEQAFWGTNIADGIINMRLFTSWIVPYTNFVDNDGSIEIENTELNFIDNINSNNFSIIDTNKKALKVQRGKNIPIKLDANFANNSALDIEVEEDSDWYLSNKAYFTYECDYDIIKKATYQNGDKDKNINLVVMCDGVVNEEMYDVSNKIRLNFSKSDFLSMTGSVNFKTKNNWLNRYYDGIKNEYDYINNSIVKTNIFNVDTCVNVFFIKTISPESGYDDLFTERYTKTILNLANRGLNQWPSRIKLKKIISATKLIHNKEELKFDDIDSFLIFSKIDSKTVGYSGITAIWPINCGYRNGMPVSAITFSTANPKTIEGFSSVLHELGHRLIWLMDEYTEEQLYMASAINLDALTVTKETTKWGLFFATKKTSFYYKNNLPEIWYDSDILGNTKISLEKPNVYGIQSSMRPSVNGVMNHGIYFSIPSLYYMEISLKVRTGQLDGFWHVPGTDMYSFEQKDYPIFSLKKKCFYDDWTPLQATLE